MDASKLEYARKFVARYVARDFRLACFRDDLIQEALIGIMTAGQKFDASRGARLSSVEWLYMRAFVSRFLEFHVFPHRAEQTSVRLGDDVEDALANHPSESAGPDEVTRLAVDFDRFLSVELPRRVAKRFREAASRERAMAVATARISGATLQEAGDSAGVSRERARQIAEKLGLVFE